MGIRATNWVLHGWLCALCAAILPPTARPFPPSVPPPALIVQYADLDLKQKSGIVELYRRVEQAARLVCTPVAPEGQSALPSEACRSDALARAVAEIGELALTRYAATRLKKRAQSEESAAPESKQPSAPRNAGTQSSRT